MCCDLSLEFPGQSLALRSAGAIWGLSRGVIGHEPDLGAEMVDTHPRVVIPSRLVPGLVCCPVVTSSRPVWDLDGSRPGAAAAAVVELDIGRGARSRIAVTRDRGER
jgi:hypothetical protein